MKHIYWILFGFAFLLCSCAGNGWKGVRAGEVAPLVVGEMTDPQVRDGREFFFSDSLNAYLICRPYPVPDCEYTPAPKGYKPVYISTYARHGSRKLYRGRHSRNLLKAFAYADSLGGLTPLGKEVIDVFQDFIAAPMAGNVQMVFYRNRTGDVLVKFLLNEVESWIPIPTDIWPYYHWDEVHEYFESLLS